MRGRHVETLGWPSSVQPISKMICEANEIWTNDLQLQIPMTSLLDHHIHLWMKIIEYYFMFSESFDGKKKGQV